MTRRLLKVIHWLNRNTKAGSRKKIAAHYDLGNEFYTSWLDDPVTYSSGVFPTEDTTLEEAQRHKYRRLLDMIDPKPGERVLEIGCGWGGFAGGTPVRLGARRVRLHGHRLAIASRRGP